MRIAQDSCVPAFDPLEQDTAGRGRRSTVWAGEHLANPAIALTIGEKHRNVRPTPAVKANNHETCIYSHTSKVNHERHRVNRRANCD